MGGYPHCMIALLLALGMLPRVSAQVPTACNTTALLGCASQFIANGATNGKTLACQAFAIYQECWNANNVPSCESDPSFPNLKKEYEDYVHEATTDPHKLCPLLATPGPSSGLSGSSGSVSLDSTSGVIDQNMMTSSGIKALWWQWTIFFCLICCCFASCGGMAGFISNRRDKRGFGPYDDYDHEGGWGGYPDAYAEPFPMPPQQFHDPMAGHSLMGWGAPGGFPQTGGYGGYGGYPQTAQMPTMHAMY